MPDRPTTTAATRCNCATFGSAAHCPTHTQADFDAQRPKRTPTQTLVVAVRLALDAGEITTDEHREACRFIEEANR